MPVRKVSVFVYHCQACDWELVWPVIVPPSDGRINELRNRARRRVCGQCGTTGQISFAQHSAQARAPVLASAR